MMSYVHHVYWSEGHFLVCIWPLLKASATCLTCINPVELNCLFVVNVSGLLIIESSQDNPVSDSMSNDSRSRSTRTPYQQHHPIYWVTFNDQHRLLGTQHRIAKQGGIKDLQSKEYISTCSKLRCIWLFDYTSKHFDSDWNLVMLVWKHPSVKYLQPCALSSRKHPPTTV